MSLLRSVWIPGLPQLLHAQKSPSWGQLSEAMTTVGREIREWGPERMVFYSSQWISVLGTSYQAQPRPKGVHVDENWHEWGDLAFDFPVDSEFSTALALETEKTGYPARTVNYEGFPIDTGTIVGLRFLDPEGKIPVSLVSSWVYADSAMAKNLGAIARKVIDRSGKKTLIVCSSLLTTRFFTDEIDPIEDRVSSKSDDEWNRKILGGFESGSLAQVSTMAKAFTAETATDMQFNAFHWLHGVWGEEPLQGRVLSYGPVWGTGAAVVTLTTKGKT